MACKIIICPKCNCNFNYPSVLKKHLQKSVRCISTDEYIYNIFNNINIFECIKCHKTYKHKTSLYKHNRSSKCSKLQNISNNTQSTTSTQQPLQDLNDNTLNNVINNTNNTTNNNNNTNNNHSHNQTTNNNNTINNNITNNNITIQHINPFCFEDIRVIPIPEMKRILAAGNHAGFKIIKAIYNKIENKNFYKPNMGKSEVAFLNTDFNLTIYKSKQFCDALFDRCIALLHHMLFLCKSEYTKNAVASIYSNIEYIETTMRTEIYDKQLQNIIESEFRNNNIDNKDRIKKFIKDIKNNNDTKDQSTTIINNILTLKNQSDDEYKRAITDDDINIALGDPKVLLGLIKPELLDEFKFKRFEETRFFKFWKDRIKNIRSYITNSKKATIGDNKYMKINEQKIEAMLNLIKLRADNMTYDTDVDLHVDGFEIDNIPVYDEEEEEGDDYVEDDLEDVDYEDDD